MLYVVAVVIGLASAGIALFLPVWLRGGRSEVLTQSGRIVPTLGIVLVLLLVVASAMSARFDALVNAGLAATSALVAGWLILRDAFPIKDRRWMRLSALLALFISVLILMVALTRVIQGM